MFKKREIITSSRGFDKLSDRPPPPHPHYHHHRDGQDYKCPYANAREGWARLELTKPLGVDKNTVFKPTVWSLLESVVFHPKHAKIGNLFDVTKEVFVY